MITLFWSVLLQVLLTSRKMWTLREVPGVDCR